MQKRTLVLTAMEEELKPFLQKAEINSEEERLNIKIWQGSLGGKEVIFVLTGIGKVNAALAIQNLFNLYPIDHVFNVGVAGGIADKVTLGDVCFANQVIQSDFDVTCLGYEKGHIPRMPTSVFEAVAKQKILEEMKEKIKYNLHLGRIISADQFVTDRAVVLKLGQEFNAIAKDMESAAIGHACYLNNTPFTIIRGISDSSGKDAEQEYENNLALAVNNSIDAFIKYFKLI
ncbi:MAG: 5'-methylthioadenosine/adenosylhomocysteine nucleosidase [Patescibacteria group bacterium]|nr:5'-methylthioadenosine/adenosylhomocysteine nucleosidase [Patescibacteria group bacterium]